jgi:hypothetical protein
MKEPNAAQLLQRQSPRNANRTTAPTSDQSKFATPAPHNPTVTDILDEPKLLEPRDPSQIAHEDPAFRTWLAADFLGISKYCLEKWRQRHQGPDFLQYPDGSVRYLLSSLIRFRAAHRVATTRQPRTQRSR